MITERFSYGSNGSYNLQSKEFKMAEPGLQFGFDAILGADMNLNFDNQTSGFDYLNQAGTSTKLGMIVTKQGAVLHGFESAGVIFSSPLEIPVVGADKIYAIIIEHKRVDVSGGFSAILKYEEVGSESVLDAKAALGYDEVLLGLLSVPNGETELQNCEYFPVYAQNMRVTYVERLDQIKEPGIYFASTDAKSAILFFTDENITLAGLAMDSGGVLSYIQIDMSGGEGSVFYFPLTSQVNFDALEGRVDDLEVDMLAVQATLATVISDLTPLVDGGDVSGTNFNTIITPGSYYDDGSSTNNPNSAEGFLIVHNGDSNIMQRYYDSPSFADDSYSWGRISTNGGSTWTPWVQSPRAQLTNKLTGLGAATSALNDNTDSGFFKVNSGATNTPIGGEGFLIVAKAVGYILQIVVEFQGIDTNQPEIYLRYYDGSWSAWSSNSYVN